MNRWWNTFLETKTIIHNDLSPKELINQALELKIGKLTASGSFSILTGSHTGRSADDKYVVSGPSSDNQIDWTNNIHKLSTENYLSIKEDVLDDLNDQASIQKPIYTIERSVCGHPDYNLGIRLITTNPAHALFAHHMFRNKVENPTLGNFTIVHHPDPQVELKNYGLRSSTAIIINFDLKEIIVVGTSYAGEIKKAVFSVLNTLLPDLGILPMHAGANITTSGNSSLFFGLSGTGKTTLSTDEGTFLLGDDEIGLSSTGMFNIEGGCYAKTLGLTEKTEPQIFQAVNTFGALLENVKVNEASGVPDFTDSSITENGRASYPLSFISGALQEGVCGVPSNIFFLTADAFGVLPAVSKLTPDQALFYFLSGYTAKLAGTEIGLKKVTATFSHCFGAPFMMRKPEVYANLLTKYMNELKINVWLINTGWYGGVYGKGKRYELSLTRNIIRAIQKGELSEVFCETEPYFSLAIPQEVPGVPDDRLLPFKSWPSVNEYHQQAEILQKLFDQNFKNKNYQGRSL